MARHTTWLELAGIVEKAPDATLPVLALREHDPLPVRRRWRHDARWIAAPPCARDCGRLDVLLAARPTFD